MSVEDQPQPGQLAEPLPPSLTSMAGVTPVKKGAKSYNTVAEKLAGAREKKEAGNALFKEKKYQKALVSYNTVFAFTRILPGTMRPSQDGKKAGGIQEMVRNAREDKPGDVTPLQELEAIEIECQTLTNMAICYIKLGKGIEARDACKRALIVKGYATMFADTDGSHGAGVGQLMTNTRSSINGSVWKIQLRMAEAHALLKDFDEARDAYKAAWDLAPDAGTKNTISEASKALKEAKRAHDEEERERGRALFSKAF